MPRKGFHWTVCNDTQIPSLRSYSSLYQTARCTIRLLFPRYRTSHLSTVTSFALLLAPQPAPCCSLSSCAFSSLDSCTEGCIIYSSLTHVQTTFAKTHTTPLSVTEHPSVSLSSCLTLLIPSLPLFYCLLVNFLSCHSTSYCLIYLAAPQWEALPKAFFKDQIHLNWFLSPWFSWHAQNILVAEQRTFLYGGHMSLSRHFTPVLSSVTLCVTH